MAEAGYHGVRDMLCRGWIEGIVVAVVELGIVMLEVYFLEGGRGVGV